MTDALGQRAIDQQHFPTPGAAVAPQPEPVQRQPKGRPLHPMFRQHGGDMRVVMLHRNQGQPEPFGEAGGVEIGVQVVGYRHRLHPQHMQQMADRFLQEVHGRGVVQVADMLRQERLVPARHADGGLQMPADRQNRRDGARQPHRHRHETPPAPQESGSTRQHPDHRVIGADDDVAVMIDHGIRDPGQPPVRLGVADRERFAAGIGGGHDQRQLLRFVQPSRPGRPSGRLVKKQVVQGSIGQHDAQPRQIGRYGGSQRRRILPAAQQDDGPRGTLQQLPLSGVQVDEPGGGTPRWRPSGRRACRSAA